MVPWSRGRASEPERTRKACELTSLGNELHDQGDPTAAAIAYRWAARVAPATMRPALQLVAGLLESGVGNTRRARRMLRQASKAEDPIIAHRAQAALIDWAIDPDFMQSPRAKLVEVSDIDRLRDLVRSMQPLTPPDWMSDSSAQAPRRRVRPLPGGFYRYLSFLLGLVAIVLVETLLFDSHDATRRLLQSWPVLIAAALTAAGAVLYWRQRSRAVRRLHLERAAPPPAENELFVLYLRSFRDDEERGTQGQITTIPFAVGPDEHQIVDFFSAYGVEEQLLRHFRRLGRLIAIGTPGQVGPPAGPERLFVPADEWQDRVRELMSQARLVVLVLGPTPGTLWEFVEAVRVVPPQRLVLVVGDNSEYEEFRELAAAALKERAGHVLATRGQQWSPPGLPDYVEPDASLGTPFFSGLITYSPSWQSTFSPLDATSPIDTPSSRMRKLLESILRRLIEYEESQPDSQNRKIVAVEQPSYHSMPFVQRLPYLAGGTLITLFLVFTRHIWAERTTDWLLPIVVGGVTYLRLVLEEKRLRRRYGNPIGPRPPRFVRLDDTGSD